MNVFRKIFFISAVGVLLLHLLIPHKHHQEMTYEEHNGSHENAKGIIGLLGLTFHQGLSSYSDNFTFSEIIILQKTSSLGPHLSLSAFFEHLKFSEINVQSISIKETSIISYDFIALTKKQRGPPSMLFYS